VNTYREDRAAMAAALLPRTPNTPEEPRDLAGLPALFAGWPAVMTIKRTQHELSRSRRHVYDLIERGELIAVRTGPRSVGVRSDSVKRLILGEFKPVSIPGLRNQKVVEEV
jgi:hypothetical protein